MRHALLVLLLVVLFVVFVFVVGVENRQEESQGFAGPSLCIHDHVVAVNDLGDGKFLGECETLLLQLEQAFDDSAVQRERVPLFVLHFLVERLQSGLTHVGFDD